MTATTYIASALFWLAIGLVLYSYAGYPLLVSWFAKHFGRRKHAPSLPVSLPRVTVLIAAHNEEACIGARIVNALSTDYPPPLLDCLIVSDGSTDATNSIVSSMLGPRVRLLACPENRGKTAALNAAMNSITADIVVFSDANTVFVPMAVSRLIRWFSIPDVSTVSGRLILLDKASGQSVESTYWKYESFLKAQEGQLGAALGANGAIYAIRREHYVSPPDGTIIDDFVIPLLLKLRHGGDIIYDPEAAAYEEAPEAINLEFKRRVRIGTGAYQSLQLIGGAFHPRHGWLAFCLVSHKLIRWMTPFLLVAALGLCVILSGHTPYRELLAFQIVGYGLFALTGAVPGSSAIAKGLRLGYMFLTMNVALMCGFLRWARGQASGTWQPTARNDSR